MVLRVKSQTQSHPQTQFGLEIWSILSAHDRPSSLPSADFVEKLFAFLGLGARGHAQPAQSFEEGSSRTRQAQFRSSPGTGVSGVEHIRFLIPFNPPSCHALTIIRFVLVLLLFCGFHISPARWVTTFPAVAYEFCSWSTFEGESLGLLLESIQGKIKVARSLDGEALPEKIWLKQQFAIGVNEVTRVLERMPPSTDADECPQKMSLTSCDNSASYPRLQAILLASDCNPRWLTRHLPSLASSRKVPLIFVKDKKRGSLRLGELVNLKTAIAIGIKVKGSAVNHIVEKVLCNGDLNIESKGTWQSLLDGEINGNQQLGQAG